MNHYVPFINRNTKMDNETSNIDIKNIISKTNDIFSLALLVL